MRTTTFFVLALVLTAICPGIALAGDVTVDGTTATFGSDAVIHNLTVKNGAIVWLQGTVITGNLTIQGRSVDTGQGSSVDTGYYGCTVVGNVVVKDGAYFSCWFAKIGGNLQGSKYGFINFLISEVDGNVQINEGGFFNAEYGPCRVGGDFQYTKSQSVRLNWFTIGGNVNISDNHGWFAWIANSEIKNDLKFCNNVMVEYSSVTDNKVGNNLTVQNNTPTATVTGNTVGNDVHVD